MKFHLLGGVTRKEALEVQEVHGHTWDRCRSGTARCERDVVAVVLLRGDTGLLGHVDGLCVCDRHEDEVLRMIRGSRGYLGSKAQR